MKNKAINTIRSCYIYATLSSNRHSFENHWIYGINFHDTHRKWCWHETENPHNTQTNACQTENAKKRIDLASVTQPKSRRMSAEKCFYAELLVNNWKAFRHNSVADAVSDFHVEWFSESICDSWYMKPFAYCIMSKLQWDD